MSEELLIRRSAMPADLPAIVEILNHYITETHHTFDLEPYRVEARRAWFESFGETGPHRLLVAENDGELLGYAASHPYRAKGAYDSSVEVTLYVSPAAQGGGVGAFLYAALFEAIAGQGLHRAYAAVALPNPGSVALHEKFGFRTVGVFREVGFKFGRYWDVEWLEKDL